jgi:hypothetical protein
MPSPCHDPAVAFERSLSERHIRGTVGKQHGVCESNTATHVNQMGKVQSKVLAERHGRGTAWEWHGMCESAFSWSYW